MFSFLGRQDSGAYASMCFIQLQRSAHLKRLMIMESQQGPFKLYTYQPLTNFRYTNSSSYVESYLNIFYCDYDYIDYQDSIVLK